MIPMKKAVFVILAYVCAWTIAFLALDWQGLSRLDFTHYFEYLYLAWTFSGGELPSFAWIGSVILFVLFVGGAWLIKRYCGGGRNAL